jgi:hypothetical protein
MPRVTRRLLPTVARPLLAALALLCLPTAGAHAAQNMLANSSFELGIDHRYAMGRWYMNGLPSFSLDDTTKVHGAVSLRAPFSVKGFRPDGPFGVELRAGAPVKVEKGKTYTFSVSLRSDVAKTSAALEISPLRPYEHRGSAIKREKISLGRQFTPQGASYPWRRYEISFTAKESGDVYWVVDVSADKPGTLWADALQFEEGSSATGYAPALDLEVGLADGALAHIHDAGAPVHVDLRAFNNGSAEKSRRARLRILNDAGTVISDKMLDVSAPAKGGSSRQIALDVGQAHGVFMAELTLPDVRGYLQDTSFSVLPKPRKIAPPQSSFGAYVTPSEEALKILSRAGFHWTATLTSANYIGTWDSVERKQGDYQWRDEFVDLYRKYGFEILLNMEGWIYPAWAKGMSRTERAHAFARYVEAAVGHYRGKIRYFTFTDEIHNKVPNNKMLGKREASWSNPQEYAEWHKIAYAAAKRANPDAQIVLNTQLGDFGPDQIFRYLSPKMVDVLAGNYYPYPGAVETMKKAADRAGIRRFWAPGVAINTWPLYFRSERPMGPGSAREHEALARKLIQSFANGAEVFFHYTATYVGNTNVYSVFEHDSSLETGGGQFAALAWLLDGFKQVKRLPMARAGLVESYRFDRRDGKSVFALWSKLDSDGQTLVFQRPLAGAEVYDRWTTRLAGGGKDAVKSLSLGDQSRFIIVPTSDADAVEQALGLARFQAASLPRAEKTARAGRYALLTQLERQGRRQKEVQSIWYDSERSGWMQLLRLHTGPGSSMAVTPDGGEVRFDYDWDGKAHHLFLGDLSAGLWGARFWRSIERDGKTLWEVGTIDGSSGPKKPVAGADGEAPPAKAPAPPAYVIEMRDGQWLTIATEGEQPNLRYPARGAWDLFAAGADEGPRGISIRRYVHGGDPHRRHILVRFAVRGRSAE